MACINCRVDYHFICLEPNLSQMKCCCGGHVEDDNDDGIFAPTRGVGRPALADDELMNPLQAGRKRAAAERPIEPGEVCEWAMLAKAGGGVRPIVGCIGNPATNLHHGPDKSTLNNEAGVNLHAICSVCHNRWHGDNDRYYGPDRPEDNSTWLPLDGYRSEAHDPDTRATVEDVEINDELWRLRRKRRRKVIYGDEPTEWRTSAERFNDEGDSVRGDSSSSRDSEAEHGIPVPVVD